MEIFFAEENLQTWKRKLRTRTDLALFGEMRGATVVALLLAGLASTCCAVSLSSATEKRVEIKIPVKVTMPPMSEVSHRPFVPVLLLPRLKSAFFRGNLEDEAVGFESEAADDFGCCTMH